MLRVIEHIAEKEQITNRILRDLPEWFGIESAIKQYVNTVGPMHMIVYEADGGVVGFSVLKTHNEHAGEIYVTGVLKPYHRRGIGRKLINGHIDEAKKRNLKFLQVKTLSEKRDDEAYRKTRAFYAAMGFYPLEVFETLWDEANPCLISVMWLGG